MGSAASLSWWSETPRDHTAAALRRMEPCRAAPLASTLKSPAARQPCTESCTSVPTSQAKLEGPPPNSMLISALRKHPAVAATAVAFTRISGCTTSSSGVVSDRVTTSLGSAASRWTGSPGASIQGDSSSSAFHVPVSRTVTEDSPASISTVTHSSPNSIFSTRPRRACPRGPRKIANGSEPTSSWCSAGREEATAGFPLRRSAANSACSSSVAFSRTESIRPFSPRILCSAGRSGKLGGGATATGGS
mmetsp:Transcript_39694/g.89047  ORF Transcript_39694/g.89047 Transcript_39694/m.89047 type:complete len:248 (+) Transcript_39694:525-1268(+)